jgi:hypothetical protein
MLPIEVETRTMIEVIQHACATFASRYRSGAVKEHATTLIAFVGSSACALMPIVLVFWLMQPKVLANPGTSMRLTPRAAFVDPPPVDLLDVAVEPPRQQSPVRLTDQRPQHSAAKAAKKRAAFAPDRQRIRTAHRRNDTARIQSYAPYRSFDHHRMTFAKMGPGMLQ